jgi:hypothetical protein
MSVSPHDPEAKRPKDGFEAAEIARANLSYDQPSVSRRWREIAFWAGLLVWALALFLLADRLLL